MAKVFKLTYWAVHRVKNMSAWHLRKKDDKQGRFPSDALLRSVWRKINLGYKFVVREKGTLYIELLMPAGMRPWRRKIFLEELEKHMKL